jgi:hypothetical protein
MEIDADEFPRHVPQSLAAHTAIGDIARRRSSCTGKYSKQPFPAGQQLGCACPQEAGILTHSPAMTTVRVVGRSGT